MVLGLKVLKIYTLASTRTPPLLAARYTPFLAKQGEQRIFQVYEGLLDTFFWHSEKEKSFGKGDFMKQTV